MKLDEDDDEIRIHSILPLTKILWSDYISFCFQNFYSATYKGEQKEGPGLAFFAPPDSSNIIISLSFCHVCCCAIYIYIYKNAQSLYLAQWKDIVDPTVVQSVPGEVSFLFI